MALSVEVVPDFDQGVIVVALAGDLTAQSAPAARAALLRSLALCPDAVIVDLTRVHTNEPYQADLLPAGLRPADTSVTVVLCGPSPLVAAAGNQLGLEIYQSRDQALRAISDHTPAPDGRRLNVKLEASVAAPHAAREAIREVCHEWGIGHLGETAALVISELVTNAVLHARTRIHVAAARCGDYLRLSVCDGGPMQVPTGNGQAIAYCDPLGESGRGLHLVNALAERWGSIKIRDGKATWAVLHATAPPRATAVERAERIS